MKFQCEKHRRRRQRNYDPFEDNLHEGSEEQSHLFYTSKVNSTTELNQKKSIIRKAENSIHNKLLVITKVRKKN